MLTKEFVINILTLLKISVLIVLQSTISYGLILSVPLTVRDKNVEIMRNVCKSNLTKWISNKRLEMQRPHKMFRSILIQKKYSQFHEVSFLKYKI